jgi:methanogenic corrinoid protein MtbC1
MLEGAGFEVIDLGINVPPSGSSTRSASSSRTWLA